MLKKVAENTIGFVEKSKKSTGVDVKELPSLQHIIINWGKSWKNEESRTFCKLYRNRIPVEIHIINKANHGVRSVQIRSYFWSEYRKIRTRNGSVFWQFSRSARKTKKLKRPCVNLKTCKMITLKFMKRSNA